MSPLDIPTSEKSHGALFISACVRQSDNTAIIRIGTSQRARSSPRARPKPLSESFIPRQLTCTHGRKKQISTHKAALSVVRLALSIRPEYQPEYQWAEYQWAEYQWAEYQWAEYQWAEYQWEALCGARLLSNSTITVWPRSSASVKAVLPVAASLAFTSAPLSSKVPTISVLPFEAASIKAVSP
jgi:hypothetical protein